MGNIFCAIIPLFLARYGAEKLFTSGLHRYGKFFLGVQLISIKKLYCCRVNYKALVSFFIKNYYIVVVYLPHYIVI